MVQERTMMDRSDSRFEWSAYETKAASISQERRSEELQLERLRLRLRDKMREAAGREQAQARRDPCPTALSAVSHPATGA